MQNTRIQVLEIFVRPDKLTAVRSGSIFTVMQMEDITSNQQKVSILYGRQIMQQFILLMHPPNNNPYPGQEVFLFSGN